jgi:hypothetical protein
MRPHNDIALTADPLETVAHLRASQAKWQAAAERIARQRDHYLQAVKDLDAVLYASGMDDRDAVSSAIDILDIALERRVPDGASQVTS